MTSHHYVEETPPAQFIFKSCSNSWLWKGRPFIDPIALDENVVAGKRIVHLLAQKDRPLDFEIASEYSNAQVLWQIDTDFWPMKAPIAEEGVFRMHKLSLEHFNKEVWRRFRKTSFGLVIGQIEASVFALVKGFYWDLEQLEQLAGWLGDLQDSTRPTLAQKVLFFLKNQDMEGFKEWAKNHAAIAQYCMQLLNQYWHYLVSSLDEDCPIFLRLEVKDADLSLQIQLLAHAGKEHIYLIGKGVHPSLAALYEMDGYITAPQRWQTAANTAIIIPSCKYLDKLCADQLATVIEILDSNGHNYRLIDEERLTEQWAGIEEIVLISGYVSPLGMRMVRGFCASMGKVYVWGNKDLYEDIAHTHPHWLEVTK